jgi:hypothetical protein
MFPFFIPLPNIPLPMLSFLHSPLNLPPSKNRQGNDRQGNDFTESLSLHVTSLLPAMFPFFIPLPNIPLPMLSFHSPVYA